MNKYACNTQTDRQTHTHVHDVGSTVLHTFLGHCSITESQCGSSFHSVAGGCQRCGGHLRDPGDLAYSSAEPGDEHGHHQQAADRAERVLGVRLAADSLALLDTIIRLDAGK